MKKVLFYFVFALCLLSAVFSFADGQYYGYGYGYGDGGYYGDYYGEHSYSENRLPDWYPDNVTEFKDFHGENLPHVVDDADMFSTEEEAKLSSLIENLVDRHGFDFVLFTDLSSHGLGEDKYAADFYQFNGYGLDEYYSGSVLYICMDPHDRCYFTAACGKCEKIYGDEVIGSIDDFFFDYMRSGDYYNGIVEYIKFIDDVYTAPEWYPENVIPLLGNYTVPSVSGNAIDKSKPHVVDNGGFYKDPSLLNDLAARVNEFIDERNTDLVVLTAPGTKCIDLETYARDFYAYGGYAEDGIIVLVSPDTYGVLTESIYAFGKPSEKISKHAGTFNSMQFLGNEEKYLKDVSFLLKAGFMPLTAGGTVFSVLIGGIAGLIRGKSKNKKAEKDMILPKAETARSYAVDNSFRLGKVRTTVLYTSVSKVPKSPPPSSSGSGGGSHTSHSGSSHSYSSSGGRSFSGGGRHF